MHTRRGRQASYGKTSTTFFRVVFARFVFRERVGSEIRAGVCVSFVIITGGVLTTWYMQKPIYVRISTHNIWSFLLWLPVIATTGSCYLACSAARVLLWFSFVYFASLSFNAPGFASMHVVPVVSSTMKHGIVCDASTLITALQRICSR